MCVVLGRLAHPGAVNEDILILDDGAVLLRRTGRRACIMHIYRSTEASSSSLAQDSVQAIFTMAQESQAVFTRCNSSRVEGSFNE